MGNPVDPILIQIRFKNQKERNEKYKTQDGKTKIIFIAENEMEQMKNSDLYFFYPFQGDIKHFQNYELFRAPPSSQTVLHHYTLFNKYILNFNIFVLNTSI